MYKMEDKSIINIPLEEDLISIYIYVKGDVYTYRMFTNNENPVSGKYTKGSGSLRRQLFFQNLIILIDTDLDDDVVINVERA